jgi:hypothetical protein
VYLKYEEEYVALTSSAPVITFLEDNKKITSVKFTEFDKITELDNLVIYILDKSSNISCVKFETSFKNCKILNEKENINKFFGNKTWEEIFKSKDKKEVTLDDLKFLAKVLEKNIEVKFEVIQEE